MEISYYASPIFDLETTDKTMRFKGCSSVYEMVGHWSSTGRFRPHTLIKDGSEVTNLSAIDIGIDNQTFGYEVQIA